MPFRIRTKLVIAFLAIIIPYIAISGIISFYNLNTIYKGTNKVEALTREVHKSHRLQLVLDMALMPVNDYIITGEKRYEEEFREASVEVERRLKEVEGELAGLEGLFPAYVKEERGILKDVGASWQKIKEISAGIFAIRNPVGNSNAASLMEEMDYKWAYPAIKGFRRWQEIDEEEYMEAHQESERALKRVVIVMIAGGVILFFFGASCALFYSRIFVRPIETIHERADAIAKGEFKTRLDVKTGDELQQLSDAMNEMAAQLDSLTSNLQGMVEERTRELSESNERNLALLNAIPDMMFRIGRDGTFLEFSPAKDFEPALPPAEFLGKRMQDVLPPEIAMTAMEHMDRALQTDTVQFFEYGIPVPLPDGELRHYEARMAAIGKDKVVAIIRDITERKQAEEKIKEQLDFLERFQKVAVKREFRIKELMERVKELEGKAKG